MKVTQLCLTLCDSMDYTVRRILQARILEWVAFPFSRRASQPKDWTQAPVLQADSLPAEPLGKPKNTGVGSLLLLQWIFLTQDSNQGLLHCKQVLYQLSFGGLVSKYCLPLVTSWTVTRQAPMSMRFSRQEYWSGLPFPSPGDLPNPGVETWFPALQADSLPTEISGKSQNN